MNRPIPLGHATALHLISDASLRWFGSSLFLLVS